MSSCCNHLKVPCTSDNNCLSWAMVSTSVSSIVVLWERLSLDLKQPCCPVQDIENTLFLKLCQLLFWCKLTFLSIDKQARLECTILIFTCHLTKVLLVSDFFFPWMMWREEHKLVKKKKTSIKNLLRNTLFKWKLNVNSC